MVSFIKNINLSSVRTQTTAILSILFAFTTSISFAQTEKLVIDTTIQQLNHITIQPITIYGIPLEKYGVGAKIQTLDSLHQSLSNHRTLADVLMEQSSIYIKQYGNGMLGSVSFRGTGAGHTAVLWNGININSLTLGEADFSNLPVFAFDKISLQTGSASALFGSDAVGGSIHLNTKPDWEKGTKLFLQQDVGSFGLWFSGIDFKMGLKNFESKTKLYRQQLENNFEFKNRAVFGFPIEKQNNAAIFSYGFLQELNYRFAKNRYITLNAWYHTKAIEIQPTMGANNQANSYTTQEDDNIRLMLDYFDNSKWGFLNAKLAFIKDDLLYNQNDKTATKRLIGALQYDKNLTNKISFQAGFHWTYVMTDVDNYAKNYRENRQDIFASFKYNLLKQWTLSFTARQALITGFNPPFSPALGSELYIFKQKNQQLLFKTLLSKSYKVPTLNARYWNPGGNLDIRPENGLSAEAGLAYQFNKHNNQLNFELTHYQMQVDDWIVWLPTGSVWSPQNVRKVNVKGIEFSFKYVYQNGHFKYQIGGNYALNQSKNQKGINANDTESIGKQLPYTPLHRANVFAQLQYKSWLIAPNFNYTSQRFTGTDNQNYLKGFALLNVNFSKSIHIYQNMLHISLQINNLLNKEYQNYALRAMPLRNYVLSVRFEM